MMINNKYFDIKPLGEGRNKVFSAYSRIHPEQKLVLKVCTTAPKDFQRDPLLNEYSVLKNLDHPAIPKTYDYDRIYNLSDELKRNYGISEGNSFLVTECFDASSLDNYFGQFDNSKLKSVILQLSDILYYVHQNNYIYCDLKPENILLDDQFNVKLIDFELCRDNISLNLRDIGGTSEYTAPEIIQKEIVDHRCDLYSLGMILYRIIYNRFPFTSSDKLEIYKAHIEAEFEFPQTDFSYILVSIAEKLLSKKNFNRQFTSLEIITELDPSYISQVRLNWKISRKFSGREKFIGKLQDLLSTRKFQNIILRGVNGSGKSAVLDEIFYANKNSIILNQENLRNNATIKDVVTCILHTYSVSQSLRTEELELIHSRLEKELTLTEAVAIVRQLIEGIDILLLIDDFETYNDLVKSFIKEIILIVKINKGRVVVTENPDKKEFSDDLKGFSMLNLPLLNEKDIENVVNRKLASFYPKDDLIDIFKEFGTISYYELNNIYNDLLAFKIIQFTSSTPLITKHRQTLHNILGQHLKSKEELVDTLDDINSRILQAVAVLNNPNIKRIKLLTGFKETLIVHCLETLSQKYVLQADLIGDIIKFSSSGLRNYVAEEIKKDAGLLSEFLDITEVYTEDFDLEEKVELYVLNNRPDEAAEVYRSAASAQFDMEAFRSSEILLTKAIKLCSAHESKAELYYDKSRVEYKLSDFAGSLEQIENAIKLNELPKYSEQKTRCLIKLGKSEEGLNLLNKLVAEEYNISESDKNLLTANALFDTGEFENSGEILDAMIKKNGDDKNLGAAYNLRGIISYYIQGNFKDSIYNFSEALEIYKAANDKNLLAGVEINIGNIFHQKTDFDKALSYWNSARKSVREIGNYDQEAKLLNSLGIHNFEINEFEQSLENYQKALIIFQNTGNIYGEALSCSNLGELYLVQNDFDEATKQLVAAKRILYKLNYPDDLDEVLFHEALIYLFTGYMENYYGILNELKNRFAETSNDRTNALIKLLVAYSNYFYFDESEASGISDDDIELFYEMSEKQKYIRAVLINSRLLIKQKNHAEAEDLLTDRKLVDMTQYTPVLESERLFLLSLVSTDYNQKKSFNYLENAFVKIEDIDITFLTIEIICQLIIKYKERGINEMVQKYYDYAISLLSFYTKKIKDNKAAEVFSQQYPVTRCSGILTEVETYLHE